MYASVESGYLKGLYRANKKIAFLTDAPAKAQTPRPTELLDGTEILCKFFFTCIKYMFLNQEKPEMDDFERRNKLWSVLKEKYFEKFQYFKNICILKNVQFLMDILA